MRDSGAHLCYTFAVRIRGTQWRCAMAVRIGGAQRLVTLRTASGSVRGELAEHRVERALDLVERA